MLDSAVCNEAASCNVQVAGRSVLVVRCKSMARGALSIIWLGLQLDPSIQPAIEVESFQFESFNVLEIMVCVGRPQHAMCKTLVFEAGGWLRLFS